MGNDYGIFEILNFDYSISFDECNFRISMTSLILEIFTESLNKLGHTNGLILYSKHSLASNIVISEMHNQIILVSFSTSKLAYIQIDDSYEEHPVLGGGGFHHNLSVFFSLKSNEGNLFIFSDF